MTAVLQRPRDAGATHGGSRAAAFRADLQGLRAVAVVVVILDHLLGWPRGGFVGVDVFFVLSGFLITGLLLREQQQTGSISFRGFYRRRVRRLIPAAALVVAVTLLAGSVVLSAAAYSRLVAAAVWSAFFGANWYFSSIGTDYFQSADPPSALQHFWSLAVEEQFYLAWPWLLLAVLALAGARMRRVRPRQAALALVAGIGAASFAWSVVETAAAPTHAYFSTLSRAWELAAGALLAIAAPALERLPARSRAPLAWVGLAAIVCAVFAEDAASGFPAPGALLPVCGALLVVAAGAGGDGTRWPLSSRPMTVVGDLSYSLYLWHLPVIVLIGAMLAPGPLAALIEACVIAAASVCGYVLVEQPIRRSSWLSGRRVRRHVDPDAAAVRRGVAGLTVVACAAVAAVAGCVLSMLAPVAQAPAATAVTLDTTGLPAPTAALERRIAAALTATAWPALKPSIDQVTTGPQLPPDLEACGAVLPAAPAACTWGAPHPTHLIVLVGDSTSLAYVPVFRALVAGMPGWAVRSTGMFGCPFLDLATYSAATSFEDACAARVRSEVAAVRAVHPDLVVVTNTYAAVDHRDGRTPVTDAEWTRGLAVLLGQLHGGAVRSAVIAPPPSDRDVRQCATPLSVPADCISAVTPSWVARGDAEAAAAASAGAAYVGSQDWFCVDASCPAFVAGVPVKLDAVHMTEAYAPLMVPAVRATLRQAGLLGR